MRRLILIIALFSLATIGRAQVVGTHQGSSDPVSEGWQQIRSFTGVSTGAIVNDLGLGINSWKISDTSNADGIYGIQLTSQQLQLAAISDWKLSSTLRVVSGPPSTSADNVPIQVAVHFHERNYSMLFGKEPSGLPWIGLPTDSSLVIVPLNNIGPNYNSFDLKFSQANGTANLYVNGGLAYTGFNGVFDPDFDTGANDRTSEFLFFGSTASNGPSGQGNHNFVQFEFIPEPSTVLLVAVGSFALTTLRPPRRSCPPK
jgi:hypothetical protein